MNKIKETERTYSFLWKKEKTTLSIPKWHFNYMQEVIDEPIVKGSLGVDIGSGCGYDTYIMARGNPAVMLVSIDLSDGVFMAKRLASGLNNVQVVKCSVSDLSLRDNIFDFAYSFGVLHHINCPSKGLLEIARVLKKNSPVFLYLYESHDQNRIKYIAIKLTEKIRKITVKMPPRMLYFLCCIFAFFTFNIFTIPSKILGKFACSRDFSGKIPFHFHSNPFSIRGDLFDRFSVPFEHRFSKAEVYDLLARCGFKNIKIKKLNYKSGWVAWGYKV